MRSWARPWKQVCWGWVQWGAGAFAAPAHVFGFCAPSVQPAWRQRCARPCPSPPSPCAVRMAAADAPFWHELPAHIAVLYSGPPPPVQPAAADAAASQHGPASQATLPLSMHLQQQGQAAAEEGEVEQPLRVAPPLPGTPAARARR